MPFTLEGSKKAALTTTTCPHCDVTIRPSNLARHIAARHKDVAKGASE